MCNPLNKLEYPDFFDTIETVKLRDPLADFLGALEDGYVEFSYLDVVKSAGHSCPSVAGAYLMALCGLKELYKDTLPVRGEIKVCFRGDSLEGVNGVIANVFTQITGATQSFGFKGIAGNFARDKLLYFNEAIKGEIKLTNITNGRSVEVRYTPEKIAIEPRQKELMEKIIKKSASIEEQKEFKILWQARVQKIFSDIDEVIEVITPL
ncbi:FmdE family protein [Sulfurimonas microaerophilic]|uniref:FmdE family protein n=1 Tax=Sulfurimonas microaerophilic TaxID=3058392 RepID=UPI002714A119|nr:FmdE family protein [Sulfurimonas sp. hsl 1-7]